MVGGGERLALMRTLRKVRTPSRSGPLIAAERLFDKPAAVSVSWTEDVVSLKARLDFLKPRCVLVRGSEGMTISLTS